MIIGTAKEGKEATCLLMSDIYCSPGYNSFERKRGIAIDPMQMV